MRENEIRPEAILRRYLELSAQDAVNCFGDEARGTSDYCQECAQSPAGITGGTAVLRTILLDAKRAAAYQQFLVEQQMSSHVWVNRT